ncbi:cytoplasmic aconitate hydratase-like isoform X2 [Sycon ciliatum]
MDLACIRQVLLANNFEPAVSQPGVPMDVILDSVFADEPPREAGSPVTESFCYERLHFLKWADKAFAGIRTIPPCPGTLNHASLLWCLARWVVRGCDGSLNPDFVFGIDSHLAVLNGLGILALSVSLLETETVLLDMPIQFKLPEVVGVRVLGRPPPLSTHVENVLFVSKFLRQNEALLKNRFVEFLGPALEHLTITDRMTIANTSTEYNALATYFPIDKITLDYIHRTSPSLKRSENLEQYLRISKLIADDPTPDLVFNEVIEVNFDDMVVNICGPYPMVYRTVVEKFPQEIRENLSKRHGRRAMYAADITTTVTYETEGQKFTLGHACLLTACIPASANASQPMAMLACGLLARNAFRHGFRVSPYIHACMSLRGGLNAFYLREANLMNALSAIGFSLVGLDDNLLERQVFSPPCLTAEIAKAQLITCGVMSGTHTTQCCDVILSATTANFTCSPPLVIAYALAGNLAIDFNITPIGKSSETGEAIYLKDIWPSKEEISWLQKQVIYPAISREFAKEIRSDKDWADIPTVTGASYPWDPSFTYMQRPPFCNLVPKPQQLSQLCIEGGHVLMYLGDDVAMHHLSPAGSMSRTSPASRYLSSLGIEARCFNTYGSRVGNHHVMTRGMFEHKYLNNRLVRGVGPRTLFLPSGVETGVYDAAVAYRSRNIPQIIIAGFNYGIGASRDWAAKGLVALGIRAVIARSYDEVHRSNLACCGVLPLQFLKDESGEKLGITGHESFNLLLGKEIQPNQVLKMQLNTGLVFQVELRLDSFQEIDFFSHSGMVNFAAYRDLTKAMV